MSTQSGLAMSQVLVPAAFSVLPAESDKSAVIETLANSLIATGHLSAEQIPEVVSATLSREACGSTGIGYGIAIPHCRTALVDQLICAYGRVEADGIDFDSMDGEPVTSVFLLLTPANQRDEHLQVMRSFASLIRQDHFCEFLRQATSPDALLNLLREFEQR